MANSTLNFYRVAFPSDTNTYVDDIESYLLSLHGLVISDFQYIRHDLQIAIKLDGDQDQVNEFEYNYCSIKNSDDDNVFFYFVDKVEQIAMNTLKIMLRMDTINSLGQKSSDYCNPRNFTSETSISREHIDRFKRRDNWNKNVGGFLVRNIHKESEGIVPDKIKDVDGDVEIIDSNANFDWYLIYKNREQVTPENPNPPIDTLLIASEPLVISKTGGGASRTLTIDDLPEGQYNYVLEVDNQNGTFTAQCDINYDGRGHNFVNRSFTLGGEVCEIVEETHTTQAGTSTTGYQEKIYKLDNLKFVNIGDAISVIMEVTFVRNGVHHTYTGTNHDVSFSGYVFNRIARFSAWSCLAGVPSLTINELNFTRVTYDGNIPIQYAQTLISETVQYNIGSQITRSTIGIDNVDRTDSKLIKIIKLPYCPVSYTKTNNIYNFGTNWIYYSGFLRYNESDGKVLPSFINNDKLSVNVGTNELWVSVAPATHQDNKNIALESKLYHSDFRTLKLVYDSFSKEIKLENIDTPVSIPRTVVPIIFKPTSTINSKFGFKLDFSSANVGVMRDEEDFNILLCTRNNEETILNNEYLNYVKTGYNYDKKQNDLATKAAVRNAGVQTAASVASIVAGAIDVAVGTKALGASLIASGVTGAISSANAWKNASDTQDKLNTSMQAKLAQLAAQSTSTSGTDDVDLMSWYSNNRLHLMKYSTNDVLKNKIWKLLDYTGYSHTTYATPDVDSRTWYNYIQCDPAIDYEGTLKYKTAWLNDVKERYNNGVTVFHHHNLGGQYDKWDFDRKYENYEIWILGE